MALLAIDPGVRGCGCAWFQDGVLRRAEYVRGSKDGARADAWSSMASAVWDWAGTQALVWSEPLTSFACELPQAYHGREKQKGDQQDLIELAATVGAVCSRLRGVAQRIYLPAEWKGQTPKEICHDRARKRLSPAELSAVVLPAKSLAHNVFDAVALGLVHLGRM